MTTNRKLRLQDPDERNRVQGQRGYRQPAVPVGAEYETIDGQKLRVPRKRKTREEKDRIIQDYLHGISTAREVGARHNVSHTSIYQWAEDYIARKKMEQEARDRENQERRRRDASGEGEVFDLSDDGLSHEEIARTLDLDVAEVEAILSGGKDHD